jgi:hypothetical protein
VLYAIVDGHAIRKRSPALALLMTFLRYRDYLSCTPLVVYDMRKLAMQYMQLFRVLLFESHAPYCLSFVGHRTTNGSLSYDASVKIKDSSRLSHLYAATALGRVHSDQAHL